MAEDSYAGDNGLGGGITTRVSFACEYFGQRGVWDGYPG